jgi:prefoldin beta subunit
MEANEKHTIEQNLHSIAVQKQALQQQLMEVDLALKELAGTTNAYRVIGGLMIQTPVSTLTEELNKKKETATNRMSMVERQEEKLKAKLHEK